MASVGSAWRPIASAPKYGKLFLGYAPKGKLVEICWWGGAAGWVYGDIDTDVTPIELTLWQPIVLPDEEEAPDPRDQEIERLRAVLRQVADTLHGPAAAGWVRRDGLLRRMTEARDMALAELAATAKAEPHRTTPLPPGEGNPHFPTVPAR
jgi:hypothetical protein